VSSSRWRGLRRSLSTFFYRRGRLTLWILLAPPLLWFAVVFAVFTPFVKEWDRDEWVHDAMTGLLLVPLAILLVRSLQGGGARSPR